MPISEAQMEGNPTNGKTYLIQWFERARFEYHPNNPGEFQVLLGLLGSEVLDCILPTITGCRELARQPGSALYIQDSDDARLSQLAGDRSAQPTWLISQWGIPTDLTGSQTAAPTTNWQIANPYGRVNYLANVNIYELGQNGQNAELPCGTEYDLFLSPVGQNFPNLPQGNSASRTLDKLDTLAFQIGAKVTYESITSRCRPLGKVDYAHYAISFVLSSTTQQTLFYQIGLRTSGLNYGPANMAWCPDYNDSRTAHQFCADDDISSVNSSLQDLTVGQRIQYATDMLPRLKQVLQSGFGKVDGERLDGNISHWKLTGVYFGLIIQGGANIASQWDSFLLIEK